MKETIVTEIRFQAKDGTIHTSLAEAVDHEKRIDGTRKTCPRCNGSMYVDPYGDGRTFVPCDYCGRKGYLDKTECWK